jgi:predicted AlkP superfamily phosphohydrolase/phosphomutase
MDASREAAIWVHVRGRYPLGRVAPGEEYERVRQRIIDGLGALRDADGRRVFGDVRRREELYHGPFVGEAPDVIAVATPSYAVSMQALRADLKAARVLGPFDSVAFNGQSGVHGDDGLYVFAGPRIATLGGHREYPIESIAPTVLHLLRLPVPRAMDGPVCASLLRPDDLAAHPVVFSDDEGTPAATAGDWASADDERVIADRLRSLGYIG